MDRASEAVTTVTVPPQPLLPIARSATSPLPVPFRPSRESSTGAATFPHPLPHPVDIRRLWTDIPATVPRFRRTIRSAGGAGVVIRRTSTGVAVMARLIPPDLSSRVPVYHTFHPRLPATNPPPPAPHIDRNPGISGPAMHFRRLPRPAQRYRWRKVPRTTSLLSIFAAVPSPPTST
jgi:hypothetical protein